MKGPIGLDGPKGEPGGPGPKGDKGGVGSPGYEILSTEDAVKLGFENPFTRDEVLMLKVLLPLLLSKQEIFPVSKMAKPNHT